MKFGQRPCTIVQGCWPNWTTTKFGWPNWPIWPIWPTKFGQRPCTIVQGHWPNFTKNEKERILIVQGLLPDFRATLKIHKKSNFDQNHLKLSTQHKYMYKV